MKQAAARRMLEERLRGATEIAAGVQHNDREGLRRLAKALDADPEDLGLSEPVDIEKRTDTVCEAVLRYQGGDRWGLFVDHVAPDDLTNTDQAADFAGMDADAWNQQLDEWVAAIRDRAGDAVADRSDRELANAHVTETFGVDLETFEDEVIDFEPQRVLQEIVLGPSETNTAAIHALAEREE